MYVCGMQYVIEYEIQVFDQVPTYMMYYSVQQKQKGKTFFHHCKFIYPMISFFHNKRAGKHCIIQLHGECSAVEKPKGSLTFSSTIQKQRNCASPQLHTYTTKLNILPQGLRLAAENVLLVASTVHVKFPPWPASDAGVGRPSKS